MIMVGGGYTNREF